LNTKIGISVLFAFILVFSTLFFLNYAFPNPTVVSDEHPFFLQEFDPNKKKIFLIGSSHVGQINNTHVIEKIEQKFNNYLMYNLAIPGDLPFQRENLNQSTISLNPEIIFYGISYRDFLSKNEENILPDFKQFTDEKLLIANTELNLINPKATTIRAVFNILPQAEIVLKQNETRTENSPFFTLEKENFVISENEDIQRLNSQAKFFEKTISEFKKNNIKTVIFITPVHQNYLNHIPEKEQNTFYSILEKISQKYDVTIYDFSQNYQDKQVWENLTHLAYNKKSFDYYDDLAKMIIMEIEK
jgi:RNase H-fold protein (predicted Holliday junction resolvase)